MEAPRGNVFPPFGLQRQELGVRSGVYPRAGSWWAFHPVAPMRRAPPGGPEALGPGDSCRIRGIFRARTGRGGGLLNYGAGRVGGAKVGDGKKAGLGSAGRKYRRPFFLTSRSPVPTVLSIRSLSGVRFNTGVEILTPIYGVAF